MLSPSSLEVSESEGNWKLTRSLACSLSVLASLFSSRSSSLNVGLSGLSSFLAGVPGTFIALLSVRGDMGGAPEFASPLPLLM